MIMNNGRSNQGGSSFVVPTPFEVSCWEHLEIDKLITELIDNDYAYMMWEGIDPENFMVAVMVERDDEIEAIRYATFGDYDYTGLVAPVKIGDSEFSSLCEFWFHKDGVIDGFVKVRETDDTQYDMRPCFYIKRKYPQ